VSYSPRKRWDLDNLPAASGPAARPLSKSPAITPTEVQLPGEREPGIPYFTMGGIAIAAIIGLAFVAKSLRGNRGRSR
jgi:hypothetical protein